MAKSKTSYICSQCGNRTSKWYGNCLSCKEWDTISLEQASAAAPSHTVHQQSAPLQPLTRVSSRPTERMATGIKEWDRVTGGGIVPGAFLILTGDPGIGKSTLLLQLAHELSQNHSVLYFSSEESLEQVKQRAERLGRVTDRILFSDHALLDEIIATAHDKKPALVIIDSLQNCYSTSSDLLPGSIGQLKEATFKLMRLAKEQTIALLVSAHITKEGSMAGPKTLEHMVDAVFYLQGEDRWQTRILRSVKNRFGAVHEIGFFEMQENGLQEMTNINAQLLEELSHSPGSVLISSLEGSRPVLLEIQALTVASKFGVPQRVISGVDHTQVVLIAAILEKYLQVKLSGHDIFFKVSGGFKLKGSTCDLGIALALLSSFFQKALPEKCIALGEISLTGHIKPVNYFGLHAAEAEKFGIKQLLAARNQKAETGIKITRFSHVYELLTLFE